METTLVLIKPSAVARGLVGDVTRRFEARGLRIYGMKLLKPDKALIEKHYAEHKGKAFFDGVCAYLASGPLVAMAIGGENAVKAVRATMGATDPADAAPGTIRGDFGLQMDDNIGHSSSDPEAAARELALWFPEGLCR
jgi:nucleoside-diphosphate kinase